MRQEWDYIPATSTYFDAVFSSENKWGTIFVETVGASWTFHQLAKKKVQRNPIYLYFYVDDALFI